MTDKRPIAGSRGWNRGKIVLFVFLSSVLCHLPLFSQEVSQQVDKFVLEGFNESGERSWEVTGDTADIFGNTIKISNVDANAFGEEQDVNITARQGEVDKKSGDVRLSEDVVVTSEDGSQLKTNSLHWEKESNIVSTADSAVITDKAIKATGVGLQANPEGKTARLERDVKVEVETEDQNADKEQQQVVITCDGPMELDQINNTATFKQNVIAVRGDQILKADKVEVHFDPETKRIATIVCTDNVSVQRDENISYAEKAIYSAADQKVIFVGRPKLIMTTDEESASFF